MRIEHVIASMDPAAGGPPMIAARLAAAQAALGHEVGLVSYEVPGSRERTEKALAGIPGIGRVERRSIAPGGRSERLTGSRAARWCAERAQSTSVFHLHGVWDSILRGFAKEARRARVPYVVVPHGMLDPWSLGQSPAKAFKKKMALALVYKGMLDGAAFLHIGNRDEDRLLEPLRLRAAKELIPNGVFVEEFASLPDAGEFHRLHPELEGRRYVLFLSRLHFKKGLDYLVDAFAQLGPSHADVRLVIAGADDGYLATLEGLIAQRGIGARTHLVGPLYGREKLAALAGAACFCLPSRQEGFSIAICEALACGLAAVISDACHFPEVGDEGAGIVVPCDARATAGALDRVLSDRALASKMGAAGRRLLETRYTWPRVAEASLAAYARHGIGARA